MIQVYPNVKAHKPDRELSWGQLFDLIRTHNHPSFVKLRNPSGDIFWEKEKHELKSKLPVFLPNVVCDGEGTTSENIKRLTGFMFFDIDKLSADGDELNNAKECLFAISYVKAVWVSPSGTGLHIIVSANPKHLTLENYSIAWGYVKDRLVRDSGIEGDWDISVKNPNRKAFISSDPHLLSREVIEEVSIPSNLRTQRNRTTRISGNGDPKSFNTTEAYEDLHSKIILPNEDFIIDLKAENMSKDGATPLWSLDMSEEVGIGYREPLYVPNLRLYRTAIPSGQRNQVLTAHIAYFMYLNRPYITDEGMVKYAKALHSRVEQTDEFTTPEPIYELLWKLYGSFDPTKTNQATMRKKSTFYNAQATLSGNERSIISRIWSGVIMDASANEMAVKHVLEYIDALNECEDYPIKAKITIPDVYRYAEKVVGKMGFAANGMALRTFYAFCSRHEVIQEKLVEINEKRPFTYEAALKWERIEDFAEKNPHVHIEKVIDELNLNISRRTLYYWKQHGSKNQ